MDSLNTDRFDRKKERRLQRRCERVGTNNYVCIASGSTNVFTADGHHIAGRVFDKNHIEFIRADIHRLLSEAQRSHPKPTSRTPGIAECTCHYCLGASDILPYVAWMLRKFAADLTQQADFNSEPINSLTRGTAHFLNAVAAFLERLGEQLNHYGHALANEAGIAEPTGNSTQKEPGISIKR